MGTSGRLTYPHTPTGDHVDDYHGTRVADPYRWLEDPDAPATRAWIEAQNVLTFDFLAGIPARDRIRGRLTALWDYPKERTPIKRGGRYFQRRNTGLQNQDVLYVMDTLDGAARVLIDPNTLSEDGTVALLAFEPSPDGRWLAYATSASGSDWLTWRVRDVTTGEDLPDVIAWSKFSGASWRGDSSGFYYAGYDAPTAGADYTGVNYYQKLYFHRLGEPQAGDTLVYARADQKEWGFGATVTDDGRYLVLNVWMGTDVRNRLFYQDLLNGGPVVELIPELEARYDFLGNDGPVFYLQTTLDAPHCRLIAIDTASPAKGDWRTLVPESADPLMSTWMVHGELIAVYLHDAHSQVRRFDRDGRRLGDIALPALGSVLECSGRDADDEMFYTFASFLYPPTVFRYDFGRGESETLFAPPVDFDASPFVTRQVFVPSRDGTRVPLFLTHRRDLTFGGQNPVLLYGYGGYAAPLMPAFLFSSAVWLELGGVVAGACLRGGGEYGEAWHEAGMLHRKQNVFDDFIACAEYLVAERITSPAKLAIEGGSNGGLLVAACMTQRPDLFGAVVARVGVMDMLRFHKFTIGWAWVVEYGSADDPAQFQTLYAYSPLHNLTPGTAYPATLITTADHDDRVVPAHSFKFTAALQAAQGGDAPVLIRVQTKAGHGFATPTAMMIDETADILAFRVATLGMGVADECTTTKLRMGECPGSAGVPPAYT